MPGVALLPRNYMLETVGYSWPWLGVIFGYGILAHGIILVNDAIYWDGWMLELWQKHRDWKSMRRFFSEVGMVNLYFEHRMLSGLPWRPVAYRLISLVSILTVALGVFLTSVYTDTLSPPQATVVALLLLSYPSYAVSFESNVSLQYTLKIALFYVGCLLAVTTIFGSGPAHVAVFAVSLLLFFAAFSANSVLVYFWGFLLFYVWLAHTRLPEGLDANEITKIALLAILPFAFWILKETLTPRHGHYKDYNRIRMSPFSVLQVAARAFRYGIDVPMLKPLMELVGWKQATLLLLSVFSGWLALDLGEALAMPTLDALKVLAAGYGLLFLCVAPYTAVGQGFLEGGWASKNFMLFHLPFALIVFGWLQLVLGAFAVLVIPVVLCANMFSIIRIHLLYIAASVKDKALIRWLAANADLNIASVIKIRDAHWIEYPHERKSTMYWPGYLSCMVKAIWPQRSILVVPDNWAATEGRPLTGEEVEAALEKTTIRYAFAQQVQSGPQYLVTVAAPAARFASPRFERSFDERGDVHPSKQPPMVRLALEYLCLKWFSPCRLGDLFDRNFSISGSRL